jgi:cyclohexanone monooxygenase
MNPDVVIVGAGFAGLYALKRVRDLGFSARVFEAGSGVGGTWFWNRYPGARCDIESLEYSYSFSEELQSEWRWSERYASQPEILRYLNHVADRFDLRRHIQLNTRVTAATFDEDANRWTIRTDGGESLSARFCIMATGCLSAANIPEIPGLDSFQGKSYHTGCWPHEGVDFTGHRVGVIGTGSSGVQCSPMIARQASHLFVFQRTPNFIVPAQNRPLSPEVIDDWSANRAEYRNHARASHFGLLVKGCEQPAVQVSAEERRQEYERRWSYGGLGFLATYPDLLLNMEANDTLGEFLRCKIRSTVRDQETAEKLVPKDFPVGTKRLCVDTGYYETFNRPNVTLIDIRATPIQEITPGGLRTADAEYALDSIVFATGFDAMTGALSKVDIRGRHGMSLKEKWSDGPSTYLGLTIAGFPNLFLVTGPGSPSVLSNMIVSIEQHVDFIADCLAYLRQNELVSIEATSVAEAAWTEHVTEVANFTLFPQANSWYVGANIDGKPRGFMPYIGGVGTYRQKCDSVAANGYEGFALHAGVQSTVAAPV